MIQKIISFYFESSDHSVLESDWWYKQQMLVSRVKAVLRACELIHSFMFNSFATPQTVAHQAPLSMEFARQEYCSEFPFPPPEDLPDPEIQLTSPVSPVLVGKLFYHWATWEALVTYGRSLIFLSQLLKTFGDSYQVFNFVLLFLF